MRSWAPLIVVLALLILLAALFGPGIYRGYLLRNTTGDLLEAALEGRTADITALVKPAQQQQVAQLIGQHLPAGYQQSISSLKLTRARIVDDSQAETLVTCKIEQGEWLGLYQGRLIWEYSQGRWEWNFEASAGAEFPLSGEPAWVKLSELMPLAESL
jgi:hypothetical protein